MIDFIIYFLFHTSIWLCVCVVRHTSLRSIVLSLFLTMVLHDILTSLLDHIHHHHHDDTSFSGAEHYRDMANAKNDLNQPPPEAVTRYEHGNNAYGDTVDINLDWLKTDKQLQYFFYTQIGAKVHILYHLVYFLSLIFNNA